MGSDTGLEPPPCTHGRWSGKAHPAAKASETAPVFPRRALVWCIHHREAAARKEGLSHGPAGHSAEEFGPNGHWRQKAFFGSAVHSAEESGSKGHIRGKRHFLMQVAQ